MVVYVLVAGAAVFAVSVAVWVNRELRKDNEAVRRAAQSRVVEKSK